MNEAFVQHAENDVDGDQRGKNQQALVGERVLEAGSGALESGLHGGRQVKILDDFIDRVDGSAQRGIGGQVKRNRD